MRRWLAIASLAVMAASCSGGPSGPTPAIGPSGTPRQFTRLGFATNCTFVVTQNGVDVWGGWPGANRIRHGHTPASPRPPSDSSCLRQDYDKSLVTAPHMTLASRSITPALVFVYVLAPNHPVGTPTVPTPGLTLHSDPSVTRWQCGGGTPRTITPYRCQPGQRTNVWVTLPSCVVGGIPAYPPCPAGSVQLPVIQLQITWPVLDATKATFTGGPFFAQWRNGWATVPITNLVNACIVVPTPCGSIINFFHRFPLPK